MSGGDGKGLFGLLRHCPLLLGWCEGKTLAGLWSPAKADQSLDTVRTGPLSTLTATIPLMTGISKV
jgi:hypothetical protein